MMPRSLFYETWDDWMIENSTDEDSDNGEEHPTETEAEILPSRFLELPGEIRNQIYNYVFRGCFVATGHFRIWNEVKTQHRTIRHTDRVQVINISKAQYPELDTKDLQLEKGPLYTSVDDWQEHLGKQDLPLVVRKELKSVRAFKHAANTGLLFTCRQTYAEFSTVLYSQSVLAFGSFSTINHMIDAVKPAGSKKVLSKRMSISSYNLPFIKRICIDCKPRGQVVDAASEFQLFRYYQQWEESSRLIATNLTGLEELTLFIEIPKTLTRSLQGPKLNVECMWVEAFLPLKNCARLEKVAVYLALDWNPGRIITRGAFDAFAEMLQLILLGKDQKTISEAFVRRSTPARIARLDAFWLTGRDPWEIMAEWNGIELPSLESILP